MKKSKRLSKTYILEAKNKTRDRYLQKTYGISLQDYKTKLARQNNACAVCKKDQSHFKSSLAVDHNHRTSKVRGLACYYCNHRLIGRHTLESASKILRYLLDYDLESRSYKNSLLSVEVVDE